SELEKLARELDAPFELKPTPANRQGRKPAPPPRTPEVPDEPLPAVGELLEHGGQRYLAVKTWEQAALAASDAGRLGATVVAADAPGR
ncbi:MAG TPA: hypothetical protein VK447_08795, partial [Myxococcaceae bacterium]|nr:hypothetical protein [Myxococcaceae bacterium]